MNIDRRYTGLMKEEFSGVKMLSLCSKSYIIQHESGKHKISCKGVSKKGLLNPMKKNLRLATKSCQTHLPILMPHYELLSYLGVKYYMTNI